MGDVDDENDKLKNGTTKSKNPGNQDWAVIDGDQRPQEPKKVKKQNGIGESIGDDLWIESSIFLGDLQEKSELGSSNESIIESDLNFRESMQLEL